MTAPWPARLRRWYGAGPLHLLSMVGCFAVAGYVVPRVLDAREPVEIAVWFLGAVVLHDLVLFPAYAALDRLGRSLARRAPSLPVAWINHVRAPLVLSGLLLLVWAPLVLRLRPASYESASGLTPDLFLGRWVVWTVALWFGSAAVYGIRLVVARSRR